MADPASFANVKLLLLCNGSNGSTTFTDSSASARTVTGFGSAQISTARSKFGGASISFDGNGDYLTVPHSTDFDFGSGDWTIELWYYRAPFGNRLQRILGKRLPSGGFQGPFLLQTDTNNNPTATFRNAAGTAFTITGDDFVLENNWHHLVIERSGNVFRLYLDGVPQGSVTFSGAVYANTEPLCIGNDIAGLASSTTAATGLLGNIDDLRITKGEALYNGSTFTPPTAELPVEAVNVQGRVAADSPLGAAALFAYAGLLGRVAAPSPLGAGQVLAYAQPVSLVAAPSPLGLGAVIAEHDFTAVLEAAGATEFYTCDIIDGAAVYRVPVSSWQGTLQVDGQCYLQAVLPAVADLASMLTSLSDTAEFVILRGARLADGAAIESEIARSVIEQLQLDRGSQRYTCTISGYSAAIVAPEDDGPPVRVLSGLRSISSGSGGVRARSAINWFLRPGCRARADAIEFVADWINFYVGGGDAYMDAGERP